MSNERILIVEDEIIAAKSLELRLRQLGYTVIGIVPSGEQAIQIAETATPALVLMDINLRGELDGIQTAEQIRARFGIPVIFTTSHDDDETLQRAKITEAFGYLVKPFETRELRNAIEMGLYKHAMECKLKESEARYRIISELISDFAYSERVAPDGSLITEWITDAVLNITGYTIEEISTLKSALSIVHPDDQEIFDKRTQALFAGKPSVDEFRIITKRGDVRWLRDYARPVWDEHENRVIRIDGAAQDITERRVAEKEIALQKARFEQLFENIPIGIALLDEHDVITSVNPAFQNIFQYTSAQVTNQSLNSVIVPPNLVEEATRLSARARQGESVQKESLRQRKDGTLVPVHICAVPIKIDQKLIGIFAIYVDISKQKQREQRLEYLSTHDTLTELYNRAYFETELLRLDRGRNYPVSIVVADVDGLKQINDTLGHAAGDELLRRAALVLTRAFRADDIVARIGGDEFAVLLPETDATATAQTILRVRQTLQKHNEASHAFPLSFSVGFATSRQGLSLVQALGEADTAMYQEKNNRHARE